MTETRQTPWNPNEPLTGRDGTIAIRFEIPLSTVQKILHKNGICETPDNIDVVKTRVMDRLNAMNIEELIQTEITEGLSNNELQTEVNAIHSHISNIIEKLRNQISYLQNTVARSTDDSKNEMWQKLYIAKLSVSRWEKLCCASVDTDGCLQKEVEELPEGISLRDAYDIYLKTYKTEV